MLEVLQYSFMQRALIAGVIIGIICPAIGVFLVLRRLSLIGETLAHVSLAGVATGMLMGIYPILTGVIFSTAAAIGIEKLRNEYKDYSELAIAIILSFGLALAIVLISLGKGFNVDVMSYLFGSIVTVRTIDVWIIFALGIIILVTVALFYKELLYLTFNEDSAQLSGLPVKRINIIFTVITALAVAMGMRVVGVLLVSSLMIIPVATSMQLAKSFRVTILLSQCFALAAVILGLFFSYYLNLATGGAIVLTSIGILIIVLVIKRLKWVFSPVRGN